MVDNPVLIRLTEQNEFIQNQIDKFMAELQAEQVPSLHWIEEMKNVYIAIGALIDSLDEMNCAFDDKFVVRIETAFDSYPFTRDNHMKIIQSLKDYPKYAYETSYKLEGTFMRLDSFKIEEFLKKAKKNVSELTEDLRKRIIKLLENHKKAIIDKNDEIETALAKLGVDFQKRRDDSIKIKQTASEIETIIYAKYDDDAKQKEIKKKISTLSTLLKAKKESELIALSTKLQQHKRTIDEIVKQVHQQFECVPEQLENLIVFDPTYAYDLSTVKAVRDNLNCELKKISEFRNGNKTGDNPLEWVGTWEKLITLDITSLVEMNYPILRFGLKDVERIDHLINTSPTIDYQPLYSKLLDYVQTYTDAHDNELGSTLQPVFKRNQESKNDPTPSLITTLKNYLEQHKKVLAAQLRSDFCNNDKIKFDDLISTYKSVILHLEGEKRLNLEKDFNTAKRNVEGNQHTLGAEIAKILTNLKGLFEISDDIRIILGELEYILKNTNKQRADDTKRKVEEIIKRIETKVNEAKIKLDDASWKRSFNPHIQMVRSIVNRIHEAQKNLPTTLNVNIKS